MKILKRNVKIVPAEVFSSGKNRVDRILMSVEGFS